MSVQKIDYEDKIGLQNDENIPNKNKVTDEDMNEIKSKVNNNADELTIAQQNIENLQTGQGTASGDITSLKNRVTTLETDNTTNKQDISSLKSRTTTLETDNETNKTNISTLQEDVEEVEGNIQQIQQEQTAIKKEIQELDDNQIHVTTERVSNINIQDCSGQNGKIKLFGISKQKTSTQGNNYFDINRANLQKGSIGEDGVTINPNAENYYTENYIELDKAKYFLYEVENNDWNKVCIYDSNKTQTRQVSIRGTHRQQPLEFELADNEKYIRFHYYTTETANRKIMLSKDSAKDYEEFVPNMPSPKYISEIENTTENIDITVCNKTLFNIDEFKDFFNLTETGTDEGHNYVAYTTNAYENNKFMQGKFKENTQYTISFLGRQKQVGQGQTSGFVFNYTDGTNSIKYVNNNVTWTKYTLTSDKNKTIDYISMAWAYGGTIWLSDIQLEVNNVATDYIENEEQTITFPLAENQKMLEGSETKDDGIHHKRKQIELNGTENWFVGSITSLRYSIRLGLQDIKLKTTNLTTGILSNCFLPDGSSENSTGYEDKFTFRQANGSKNLWFFVPKNFFTATTSNEILQEWKTYLAQQKTAGTPVIAEYETEEETIEAYTEEQQEEYNQSQNAKTYKTVTNVFTENAEVEMKYVAHTKTYVDNEINSVKEQLNTIKELLSTTTTSAMLLDNMQTDLESEVL